MSAAKRYRLAVELKTYWDAMDARRNEEACDRDTKQQGLFWNICLEDIIQAVQVYG